MHNNNIITIYSSEIDLDQQCPEISALACDNGFEVQNTVPTEITGRAIIITQTPNNYDNINSNIFILVWNPAFPKLSIDVLKQIVSHDVKSFLHNDSSPLIQENNLGLKSIAIEMYLKQVFGDVDFDWKDCLSVLYNLFINVPVSAGGVFPFTIFSNDYAKKILGDNEGLIIWSTVSSAIANYAISLRSIAQLPSLILSHLPQVFKKCIAEFDKHKLQSYDLVRIFMLTAVSIVVNTLSIYASLTLAQRSTEDFANRIDYHNEKILSLLTLAEIIGTIALVFRATLNKYVDWSLNDIQQISQPLKLELLKKYNDLLSNKLTGAEIQKLSQGNLEKRTTQVWGLAYLYSRLIKNENPYEDEGTWSWRDVIATTVQYGSYAMITGVALYSAAYGILAADAVTSHFTLRKFIKMVDPYASFVTLMNFISKPMLLGSATLSLSEFIKNLLSDNIISTHAEIRTAVKASLYGTIFITMGWNTWFSASKIMSDFFWSELAFDVVVGIVATASINYLDTCSVLESLMQGIKNTYYKCRAQTPELDFDCKIKLEMLKIAKMPARDFAALYSHRYGLAITEQEFEIIKSKLEYFLTLDSGSTNIFDTMKDATNALPNDNYIYQLACLQELNKAAHCRDGFQDSFDNIKNILPDYSKYKQATFFWAGREELSAEDPTLNGRTTMTLN